ncbi:hypothetical protein [Pedobacter sp. AJM]|uniref:hypothetical protein n=1 Tax=Pedobacter sp. AJM TaxID=2003629 RepID=UPI000B4A7676|nr:hypothetical protein [Pedobacter sp. AJM]OWK68854.1 hypothetical protein CBW18_19785 [Pedobacter sp. AJM]
MKGKKMTYFLICCVALVWGIIFRQIFLGSQDNDTFPITQHVSHEPYFNMVDHADDKVKLDMAHGNPFQTTALMEKDILADEPYAKPLEIKSIVKPKVNWSGISYKGQIYNTTEKRHVAIIAVNGKEVMLSEGEGADGLKFIKRTGDSIKVEYQHAITYLSIK